VHDHFGTGFQRQTKWGSPLDVIFGKYLVQPCILRKETAEQSPSSFVEVQTLYDFLYTEHANLPFVMSSIMQRFQKQTSWVYGSRAWSLLLLLALPGPVFSQKAVVPSGGTYKNNHAELSFSIGQVGFQVQSAAGAGMGQGVQQAYRVKKDSPGQADLPVSSFLIYPNPTASDCFLKIQPFRNGWWPYTLFDNAGKVVSQGSASGEVTRIPTKTLPAGTYFLHLKDSLANNQLSFKIIKY